MPTDSESTSGTESTSTQGSSRRLAMLQVIGPGILVAATGVGTGDLVTGALAGTKLGVMVLWAVLVGAALKFVINEGLARWQLATGETVLEGVAHHVGRLAIVLFLAYLVLWTYVVAAALMSACGAAFHAILPMGSPDIDKFVYGLLHSLVAVGLVEAGGYRWFERVMRVCIGVMFLTVVLTAIAIRPDWGDVVRGLAFPSLPTLQGDGLRWTVGLVGGVGGTVTVLCYGYWIREENRESVADLTGCRVDLAVGYLMTALFGIAMVIIGSRVTVSGSSVTLLVSLAETLGEELGTPARWAFLIGAWGAIFSSLLGVWQSVPYLFADTIRLLRGNLARQPVKSRRSRVYHATLFVMATIPVFGMRGSFAGVQLTYAICGALFVPLLATALLWLNGSRKRIGRDQRNGPLATIMLLLAIGLFVVYGYLEVRAKFG